MTEAPAGGPVALAHGALRATVTPIGAALRTFTDGGVPVVEDFENPDGPAFAYQGDVLAPWPNRVIGARYCWAGVEHALPVTEPERGHALHGLVTALPWTVLERGAASVALGLELAAAPGWPFPLRLRATYALGDDGLVGTVEATSTGADPCPYGAGVHPYLSLRGARADDCALVLRAATWLPADERLAPVGRAPTAGSPYDLAAPAPLGARALDTAFADLERDGEGGVEARLLTPDGRATVLRADAAARFWQVFTGDSLPAPWTRRAVAVEPMTCAPDALNSGDGLVVLAPGETHRLRYRLALEEA